METHTRKLQAHVLRERVLFKFLSFFFAISAVSVAIPCTIAQQQASQLTTKEVLKSGDINIEFSRVYIFVDKAGLAGHQHAIEGQLSSGHLFVKESSPARLIFNMKSFDADGPRARKYLALEGTTDESTRKKVNENMLGVEILSVNEYPEATLSNASLKPTGKMSKRNLPEITLAGDFTLHKVTRPVQARCDMEEKDGWLHIRGGFKILQSDYGIKPFSKMMGAVGVKDELLILGDLWVVPTP